MYLSIYLFSVLQIINSRSVQPSINMISMVPSILLQGVEGGPHRVFALHGINLLDVFWVVYQHDVSAYWTHKANHWTILVE